MHARRLTIGAIALAALVALPACNTSARNADGTEARSSSRSLPGSGLFRSRAPEPVGIGVNSFLWRASLDTLSFMPLSEVDPFGGVIITDWYNNPELPSERFKMTVYILDTRLRADALSVQVFRQERGGAGDWVDAPTAPATAIEIENSILTRARELRIATLDR